jgi:hypothetical protein
MNKTDPNVIGRLLVGNPITRRWVMDPLKGAGDLFIVTIVAMFANGFMISSPWQIAAGGTWLGSAVLFSNFGKAKAAFNSALVCNMLAMGFFWKSLPDASLVQEIGMGAYIGAQTLPILLRESQQTTKIAFGNVVDWVKQSPIRATGWVTLASRTPLIIDSAINLADPDKRAPSAFLLAISLTWAVADLAMVTANSNLVTNFCKNALAQRTARLK